MKVSVAHLIPAPFTLQVTEGLMEAGMLDKFYCTLVDQPHRAWQRVARGLASSVGFDLAKDLRRRSVGVIPMDRVESYPWREILRMMVVRGIKDPVIGDAVFHWGRDGFDNWVARRLHGIDAIYGYEYGSLAMFRAAKERGIHAIYDMPSPEHDFVERLLAPEFERFPGLKTSYRKMAERKHRERTDRRRMEWELADLAVANSTFTADSWRSAGWQEKSVAVIPYGAPPVSDIKQSLSASGPLRCLWAGTFSVRKGAHYLIEALRAMGDEARHVEISVYGAVTLPEEILKQAPPSIVFRGSVPRSELFAAMQSSELLVFPTLCDGFGLVVNEALAQGLPVLTTRRAGAADLIREGINGWIIEAGSTVTIIEGLRRCLSVRDELPSMREAARETAASWQWSDYRKAIAKAMRGLGQEDVSSEMEAID